MKTEMGRYADLAQKFVAAGEGNAAINQNLDLMLLGIRPVKKYKCMKGSTIDSTSWEGLCTMVYERLLQKPLPASKPSGAGFRSEWYGRKVADAIHQRYFGDTKIPRRLAKMQEYPDGIPALYAVGPHGEILETEPLVFCSAEHMAEYLTNHPEPCSQGNRPWSLITTTPICDHCGEIICGG